LVKTAVILAASIFSVATAAHAGELSDTQTQSDQLREQNKLLTKRIEQLEKRQRKLEAQSATHSGLATQPVFAARPAKPTDTMAADYKKAPPFPADDGSLTYRGITLYGTIDMGLGYQTHGTPLNGSAGFGLEYLISKNSNHPYFGLAPNALSASNVGLKGIEEVYPGLSVVFNLQTSFVPTSGKLADGLASIVQNNGVPLGSQTSNADSSKAGQAFNTAAYAGLSSPTYGTLTFGRQNALTSDGVLAYDPMSGSGAFSLIGFQGATAGMGDTENARLDSSLKYRVNLGPFRAAAAGQVAPSGDGTRNVVEGQFGVDYLGASFDAIYSHVNDAISAAPFAVGVTPTLAQFENVGRDLSRGLSRTIPASCFLPATPSGRLNFTPATRISNSPIRIPHWRLARPSSAAIRSVRSTIRLLRTTRICRFFGPAQSTRSVQRST